MNAELLALGAATAALVVGLVALLYGEYAGMTTTLVPVGGVVALTGVGILTAHVARLPDPEESDEAGH
ncbi:hypothetical protein NDI76_09400 [Halogeometricum sp. S1BR25-6]|uniref:Uncharacterized protein n=1 Tax=Halogeometricum salsisoli TaxID=2950536 RepID=A0ABU2GDS4_9EURY|nr:hypothetical protein [Halogeometricum sp. S1BR25-6]MDS0298961.1 hypothetical protein [Halogeometricum sp. S1BR25-6]